jgi:hypothetical protein
MVVLVDKVVVRVVEVVESGRLVEEVVTQLLK